MGSLRTRAAAAAAVAVALASSALAGDIIVNSNGVGEPVKGANPNGPSADDFSKSNWEVIEENLDVITYRIGDIPQPQTRATDKVKAIFHDPTMAPQDLLKGIQLADRDFEGARAAFAKVAKDPEAAPWAKAEAAFRSAGTWVSAGNPGQAEKDLAAFKASFPKSRWIPLATERRAQALMALERIDDAKAEFSSLKKLPGVAEEVGVEADFWLVWIDEQVALRRGDQAALAGVLKAYEGLITRVQGKTAFEAVLRRCQSGRASCMIALGKAPEAKVELEKLIKDTKDQRALASLYNKLGSATWRSAGQDKAELRQALYHFLRVVVLYGDVEGTDEDTAEAMFHAGELFRELRDQGSDWVQRARREWNEVIARYPGSDWARKAKQALNER